MIAFVASLALMSLISGCAITSSQVTKEYNDRQVAQYREFANAKAEAIKAVMDALSKMERGGMSVEIGDDGKVKAIKYTDRLDTAIIAKSLDFPTPKLHKPRSAISEFGDFILKLGSVTTPIASMYYGYRTAESNNKSRVAITQSNNMRDSSMYDNYTSRFTNTRIEFVSNDNNDSE